MGVRLHEPAGGGPYYSIIPVDSIRPSAMVGFMPTPRSLLPPAYE